MARNNSDLHTAKRNKADEFYTRIEEVEAECKNYVEHFRGKTIYCNCDSIKSNFVKYFALNFEFFGLKKLIATCYNENGHGQKIVYEGDKNGNRIPDDDEFTITELEGNGSFDSPECLEILEIADIVVTNPPFSLFREYVTTMERFNKKYLIIGNQNAITYKEIFPLIKENKLWLGVSMNGSNRWFRVPDNYEVTPSMKIENGIKYAFVKAVVWFTNLDTHKRHERLMLYKEYKGHEDEYPKYDNYDAINVDNVNKIPIDYNGVMGVPITFLHKYNPEQFEIVAFRKGIDGKDLIYSERERVVQPYFRILIRSRVNE